MPPAKPRSFGPRISILSVLLAGILGLGFNMDALFDTPPDAEAVEGAETEAAEGTETETGTEAEAAPAPDKVADFDMETHIATVVLQNATQAILEEAAKDLPPLAEEWTRADLQVDETYIEDEDEAEYYEELDQLKTVMKASPDRERAALAKLFEKRPGPKAQANRPAEPKPAEPAEPAKAKKLAIRPSAALITKKSEKPRAPIKVATKRPSVAPREVEAAPKVEEPKAEEPKAEEPKAAAFNPDGTAKELTSQGRKLLLSGNPGSAEKAYRLALKKSPSSARARYGLAKALYQQNRARDAAAELQRILNGNKNHGSALLMMGSLLQEQGQAGQARTHYQRYLDTHPNGRRADEVRSILSRL